MKRIALVLFAATLAGPVFAQSGSMKDMDGMKGMEIKGMDKQGKKTTAHKAIGVVKKIDATNGKVTIAHEPIPSMNWPSMTMAFTVKDKKLLEKVAVDKKVDFDFVQQGKDYVVTSVK